MIHIDTHIAIWLFNAERKRLTTAAMDVLAHEQMGYSPMVRHELNLLYERERLPAPSPDAILQYLSAAFNAAESQIGFNRVIDEATSLRWTRDPFDRLIVANAIVDGARLVTADERILEHFKDAVW